LNSLTRSDELIYVPIKFHAVAEADGEGRVFFESILDQLCELNIAFEPFGFKFYMADGTINNIDNNTIFYNPGTSAGVSKMVSQKNDFGSNALNIFLTENADTDGLGITLGYYTFAQDWIVIKKSVLTNQNHDHFVMAHEIGHFLSLDHTFNGWDSEPWDGTPVTSTLSPGGILNELVDGSNCEEAGDFICDTPADYNLGFGWDGCKEYDGGCTDINGDLLNPDETNFMGYFIGCDEYTISDDQLALMIADYESPRRSYLRVSYQPNDAVVSEKASVIAPADDSTTPFFNGVELSWTEVENATHYFIELRQGLFKTTYLSQTNKLFLTDLKEDKSYKWRVVAYNEISTCAPSSDTWNFRTGTGTTSTVESQKEAQFTILQNPTNRSEINFQLKSDYTGPYNSQIIDINGNKISETIINKTDEKEIFRIENLALINGIYIIKLNFAKYSIAEKFIVNE
jgi:hypothetical protein